MPDGANNLQRDSVAADAPIRCDSFMTAGVGNVNRNESFMTARIGNVNGEREEGDAGGTAKSTPLCWSRSDSRSISGLCGPTTRTC